MRTAGGNSVGSVAEALKRPLIPKRLAARVRGAQRRVTEARWSVLAGDLNEQQSERRLADFYSDPSGFARRYYGSHGVDSYPVQTTISREHERLDYNQRRKEARLAELAEAEVNLAEVEAAVLGEVAVMRPSKGRVQWPRSLPSFEQYREHMLAEQLRLDQEYEERRAREEPGMEPF